MLSNAWYCQTFIFISWQIGAKQPFTLILICITLSKMMVMIFTFFDYACVHVELLQECPTLCDPMYCSPPGSLTMYISSCMKCLLILIL